MVPFSNLLTEQANLSFKILSDSSRPLSTIPIPNSLEAWIQQSLNKEAEVVRDFPPAMLVSVKRTASSGPPDEI